ncbi:MAG: hypothetical protein DMF05_12945, partial [Verrucomicrobia bacterium]
MTNGRRFDALSCVSVLMTSLAAALGMMPLAWAFGSGADMLRLLVIAVIGGLYEQQQIAFRGLTVQRLSRGRRPA